MRQEGVKGYVVITSGFAEVGNKKDEEELVRIAKASGGRVIGPNIVGTMINPAKANASFAPFLPYNGRTALISQSGALIIALDIATFVRRLGVSSMISLGNMADVDFADCIDYYAQDPNTNCIALYVEGVKNGRNFMEAGRRAGKPIIALKAGVSAHGAAAAASHTGSLAGSVKVYHAAFNQAHVIWATDLDDLLNKSQALAMQPVLKGDNIVIITNGGGIGVLGSDAAERHGVPLKPAPAELQAEFRKFMPDFGSPKNPVDITGGAAWRATRGRSRPRSSPPGATAWRALLRDRGHQGHGHRRGRDHQAVEKSRRQGQAGGRLLRRRRGQRGGGQVLLDASIPILRLPQQGDVGARGAAPGGPVLGRGLQGRLRAIRRRGQEARARPSSTWRARPAARPHRARGQGLSSPPTACR